MANMFETGIVTGDKGGGKWRRIFFRLGLGVLGLAAAYGIYYVFSDLLQKIG